MSDGNEAKAARKATRRRLATLSFFAKAGLMCLSFLISLMLYLYVQSQTPPLVTRDVTVKLRVVPPSDFWCSADGLPFTVTVTGTQAEVSELQETPSKLAATVNVQRLIQGLRPPTSSVNDNAPVVVRAPVGMDDLTLDYRRLYSVDLEVKKRVLKQIEVRSVDKPGVEISAAQRAKVDVEPSVVWLSGPASRADQVIPIVEVDFSELGQPEPAKVNVVNSSGNLDGFVTSDPEKVQVSKVRNQATAFLNIVFTGHPAPGFAVTGYDIQPTSSVLLTGPPELVAQQKTVDLQIDVSDLRDTKAFNVTPNLPPGLALAANQALPIVVTVTIERRRR